MQAGAHLNLTETINNGGSSVLQIAFVMHRSYSYIVTDESVQKPGTKMRLKRNLVMVPLHRILDIMTTTGHYFPVKR